MRLENVVKRCSGGGSASSEALPVIYDGSYDTSHYEH